MLQNISCLFFLHQKRIAALIFNELISKYAFPYVVIHFWFLIHSKVRIFFLKPRQFIFRAKLCTHQYCVGARPRLVAHLILKGKVLTIRTVRQPVFRHPLRIILSALNAYFGYFSTFTKIHLNPLSLIVCPGRPRACSAPSCHVVDSGIVRPVVDIPLVSTRR